MLLAILLLVWPLAAGLGGCARSRAERLERFTYAQLHMGSKARVVLYAPDERQAREAAKAAFDRLAQLDAALSDYRQDSEINLLCARPTGVWTPVSQDLFAVLSRSRDFSQWTGGAFDATVGPLSALWRQARRNGSLPDASDLAQAHARVGWDRIDLNPQDRTARLTTPDMRIDFGAIGKGYGADQALQTLRDRGFPRALVDVGGDMAVGDPPPGEKHWLVHVETGYPQAQRPTVLAVRCGVATSGDTEQYVELNGRRYSHILDPATGLGLTTRTAATVVAPDGAAADALASAACVLGPEKAADLLEETPGVGVRMISGGVESRFGPQADRIVSIHGGDAR